MRIIHLGLVFLLVFSPLLNAEELVLIQGLVVSDHDREPIPYALVEVTGFPDLRTRADEEGVFELSVPTTSNLLLKASINGDLSGESKPITINTAQLNDSYVLALNLTGEATSIAVVAQAPINQPSHIKMDAQQIRQVAGTAGDPLKAIQTLPGVAISQDMSSAPAVRGSRPGDNIYYVDFLPIGYLYHADGSVSVLQGDFVKDITFFPSAFGPEYGDRLGAAFDITLFEPATKQWQRTIDLSFLGANFSLQGPINDKQALFFGYRRSYLDLALKALNFENNTGQKLNEVPNYYDYQGKYVWRPRNDNTLSFHLNGAEDHVSVDWSNDKVSRIHTEDYVYHTQALVWDYDHSKQFSNKMAMGVLVNNNLSNTSDEFDQNIDITRLYGRDKINIFANKQHQLIAGVDAMIERLNFYEFRRHYYCHDLPNNCDDSSNATVDVKRRLYSGAAYLKERWSFADQASLSVGLRYTNNTLTHQQYLEPRLGLDWNMSDSFSSFVAWGRYNQRPWLNELLSEYGNPALKHLRADHYVGGISQSLSHGWSWKTEIYYKDMWNLVNRSAEGSLQNEKTGKAYGVEVLIKKDMTDNIAGWLSFTGARSYETLPFSGETIPRSLDQPIIVSYVMNFKLAQHWALDFKWYFHSGTPYTPIVDVEETSYEIDEETSQTFYYPVYGDTNSARIKNYHRLDVRASKQIQFDNWKSEFYLGIINLYNRKNVSDLTALPPDFSSYVSTFQMPFFITLGAKASF